jgi:hypothetical protein
VCGNPFPQEEHNLPVTELSSMSAKIDSLNETKQLHLPICLNKHGMQISCHDYGSSKYAPPLMF